MPFGSAGALPQIRPSDRFRYRHTRLHNNPTTVGRALVSAHELDGSLRLNALSVTENLSCFDPPAGTDRTDGDAGKSP